MRRILLVSGLASILIGINVYAQFNACSGISVPESDKPTCEMIKQLEDLNSKLDETNSKLEDVNQKLNDIESDLQQIKSNDQHDSY